MNILLPKMLNKASLIEYSDLEFGKVYLFGHYLASETTSGCIIAIDTNDNGVLTFNDSNEFGEWLSDNGHTMYGELTEYQMQITIK